MFVNHSDSSVLIIYLDCYSTFATGKDNGHRALEQFRFKLPACPLTLLAYSLKDKSIFCGCLKSHEPLRNFEALSAFYSGLTKCGSKSPLHGTRHTAKTISATSLVLQQYIPEKANDSFQV